jgi:hypothetical protein
VDGIFFAESAPVQPETTLSAQPPLSCYWRRWLTLVSTQAGRPEHALHCVLPMAPETAGHRCGTHTVHAWATWARRVRCGTIRRQASSAISLFAPWWSHGYPRQPLRRYPSRHSYWSPSNPTAIAGPSCFRRLLPHGAVQYSDSFHAMQSHPPLQIPRGVFRAELAMPDWSVARPSNCTRNPACATLVRDGSVYRRFRPGGEANRIGDYL